jgi:RNA polymerase sigma factor (sigma-70 family)
MTKTNNDHDAGLLLEQWRAGKHGLPSALVALVRPWMRAAAHRAMGTVSRAVEDSEDLVQDLWLKLLGRLRFVPRTIEEFRGLVMCIARNDVVDRIRRQRGAMRHTGSVFDTANPLSGAVDLAHGHTAEGIAAQSEEADTVALALQFLPDDDRYIVVAHEIEDLSWEAIAEHLKLDSAESARMRYNRMKPRLAILVNRVRRAELPDVFP